MDFILSFLLRPMILIVLFVGVLYPCRLWVMRKMKDGKLKRLLLRRIA